MFMMLKTEILRCMFFRGFRSKVQTLKSKEQYPYNTYNTEHGLCPTTARRRTSETSLVDAKFVRTQGYCFY